MSFPTKRLTPRLNLLSGSRRSDENPEATHPFSLVAIAALLTVLLLLWVGYRWLLHPQWFDRLSAQWVELFDLVEFGVTITVIFLWSVYLLRRGKNRRSADAASAEPEMAEPTIDNLYSLSPKAFEHYVAALFRRKGYRVLVRGQAGDLGVDLEVSDPTDGKDAIVQCKRYRNTIGPDIVRELYGTLLHERVAHAFLVTTADISDAARQWANNKPLTLIDGSLLVEISRELSLQLPASLLPQTETDAPPA